MKFPLTNFILNILNINPLFNDSRRLMRSFQSAVIICGWFIFRVTSCVFAANSRFWPQNESPVKLVYWLNLVARPSLPSFSRKAKRKRQREAHGKHATGSPWLWFSNRRDSHTRVIARSLFIFGGKEKSPVIEKSAGSTASRWMTFFFPQLHFYKCSRRFAYTYIVKR